MEVENPPRAVQLVGSCGIFHVNGAADRRLGAIASEQHGVVSRQQLLDAGLTSRQIDVRLSRGQIARVHQGVYTLGGDNAAKTPLAAETAALLACGPRAVLSRSSALQLWRLLPTPPRSGVVDAPGARSVEVSVTSGQRGRLLHGITLHRTKHLPSNHIRNLSGLPVTSPERTLLDCAPLLTPRQLERALDEALAQHATSRTKLRELLTAMPAAHGRGRLAALLTARRRTATTVTDSDAEEAFLKLIRDAGLPDPVTQAQLCGFRVDAYWPDARFAVEIDGFQWHTTKSNFERDRRKEQALTDNGIELSRTTWHQIQDEPLRLAAHLARRIGRSS